MISHIESEVNVSLDLAKKNIDNLTSLWRTVAESVNGHVIGQGFEFSAFDYSEWPNRLWFSEALDQQTLKAAKDVLDELQVKMGIPYWDIYPGNSHELLENGGFRKKSEQVGMSLLLEDKFGTAEGIRLVKVAGLDDAILWEDLFRQAFGYTIHHQLIVSSMEAVDYLIAWHYEEPIGTALLFFTAQSVAGIHSMGVIPSQRRKGYAEKMMISLLDQCVRYGYRYATLQASAMGKSLYEKMGFQDEFIMTNYIRNP